MTEEINVLALDVGKRSVGFFKISLQDNAPIIRTVYNSNDEPTGFMFETSNIRSYTLFESLYPSIALHHSPSCGSSYLLEDLVRGLQFEREAKKKWWQKKKSWDFFNDDNEEDSSSESDDNDNWDHNFSDALIHFAEEQYNIAKDLLLPVKEKKNRKQEFREFKKQFDQRKPRNQQNVLLSSNRHVKRNFGNVVKNRDNYKTF